MKRFPYTIHDVDERDFDSVKNNRQYVYFKLKSICLLDDCIDSFDDDHIDFYDNLEKHKGKKGQKYLTVKAGEIEINITFKYNKKKRLVDLFISNNGLDERISRDHELFGYEEVIARGLSQELRIQLMIKKYSRGIREMNPEV